MPTITARDAKLQLAASVNQSESNDTPVVIRLSDGKIVDITTITWDLATKTIWVNGAAPVPAPPPV